MAPGLPLYKASGSGHEVVAPNERNKRSLTLQIVHKL